MDIFPEVESLYHKEVSFLIFRGNSILLSTVALVFHATQSALMPRPPPPLHLFPCLLKITKTSEKNTSNKCYMFGLCSSPMVSSAFLRFSVQMSDFFKNPDEFRKYTNLIKKIRYSLKKTKFSPCN